jgi:glucosyl-3-phosphoglycerate synthase
VSTLRARLARLAERAARRWRRLGAQLEQLGPWLRRLLALPARPPMPGAEPVAGRARVPARLPLAPAASIVIPALNEARHIAGVVAFARADASTAEVIVIDDSSTDDTVAQARGAGARVITSTLLGKGASMADGVRAAGHEIVVFLDGDLSGLRPGLIHALCAPLLADEADFVKARFSREGGGGGGGGGRVTELTARPMLKVFFPELSHLTQPLGGIVAARRALLAQLDFDDGWGVDIGLVIDAQRAGARLAEVDIGSLVHDSQPLADLGAMANEVAAAIYRRALAAGRLHADQIVGMLDAQRQAAASLDHVVARWRGQLRLLLLDASAVVELATLPPAARPVHAPADLDVAAAALRFVHRRSLEQVARDLPLRAGVVELVNRMRRHGFMVGLVGEGWFVALEILRRRVFADFALGHTLVWQGEVCTGQWRANGAWLSSDGTADGKAQLLRRLRATSPGPALLECWAIGGEPDDLALLRGADTAFAFEPLASLRVHDPHVHGIRSYAELLARVSGLAAEVDEATLA